VDRPGPPDRSLGVVALAPDDAPGTLDWNKLSIEPRHIRGGVGRALLAQAIAEVRRRGAERLTILADPNAAGFYERTGAALGPAARRRPFRSAQSISAVASVAVNPLRPNASIRPLAR